MEWGKEKDKESNSNTPSSTSVFGVAAFSTTAPTIGQQQQSTAALSPTLVAPSSIFGSTSASVFGGAAGGTTSAFGGATSAFGGTSAFGAVSPNVTATTTTAAVSSVFSKPSFGLSFDLDSNNNHNTTTTNNGTTTTTTTTSNGLSSPKGTTPLNAFATPFKPKPTPKPSTPTTTGGKGKFTNTIHVSKLPRVLHGQTIKELKQELRSHFDKYGSIKEFNLIELPFPYLVVSFNTVEEASEALKKGRSFKNFTLIVKPYIDPDSPSPSSSHTTTSSPSVELKSQEELLRNRLKGHLLQNNNNNNNNVKLVSNIPLPQIILPDTTSTNENYDNDNEENENELDDEIDEIDEIDDKEQDEEEEKEIGVKEIEENEEIEEIEEIVDDIPTPISFLPKTPTTPTTTTTNFKPTTPNHIIAYQNNNITPKVNLIGTTHQPITKSIDSETGHKVGLCLEFCPPKEKSHRESSGDINTLEKLENGELRLVKKYKRNVAEEYTEIPPEEIRPPHILSQVMSHLTHYVVDRKGIAFTEIQNFIRDRSRSLRQDLTSQHSKGSVSIDIHERCVRFHIVSHHFLCEHPEEEFNQFQNLEQMNNCLTSLKLFYDDHYKKHNCVSPNEAEFRSYYILNLLEQQSDLVSFLISIPQEIRSHPLITYVMDLSLTVDDASDQVNFRYLDTSTKVGPTVSQIILGRAPKTFQQVIDVPEPVQQSYLLFSKNEHPSLPSTPPITSNQQHQQQQNIIKKQEPSKQPTILEKKPTTTATVIDTTSAIVKPPITNNNNNIFSPSFTSTISPTLPTSSSTTTTNTTLPSNSTVFGAQPSNGTVFGNQSTSIFGQKQNIFGSEPTTTTKTTPQLPVGLFGTTTIPKNQEEKTQSNGIHLNDTSSIGVASLFPPPDLTPLKPETNPKSSTPPIITNNNLTPTPTPPKQTTTTKLPDLFKIPSELNRSGSGDSNQSFTPMAIGKTPMAQTPNESPMHVSETPFGRFPSANIFQTPSPSPSPSPMSLSTPFVKPKTDVLKFPHDKIAEEVGKQISKQPSLSSSSKSTTTTTVPVKPQKPKKSHQEKSNRALVGYLFRDWFVKTKQYKSTKNQIKKIENLVITTTQLHPTTFNNDLIFHSPLSLTKKKNHQKVQLQKEEEEEMDRKEEEEEEKMDEIQETKVLPINIAYSIYQELYKKNKNNPNPLYWKLLVVSTTDSTLCQLLSQNQQRQDYTISKTEQSSVEYISLNQKRNQMKRKLSKKPINICIQLYGNNNNSPKIFKGLSSILFEIGENSLENDKKLINLLHCIYQFGYQKRMPLLFIGRVAEQEIKQFIQKNQDLWEKTISFWTTYDIVVDHKDNNVPIQNIVNGSLVWLAEHTQPIESFDIIPLASILGIVTHDLFQNMFKSYPVAGRYKMGLPLAVLLQPKQIIDKFNQLLDSLASLLTDPHLQSSHYWPIPEFSSDHLQSWNSNETFTKVKKSLESIKLPSMDKTISSLVGLNYSNNNNNNENNCQEYETAREEHLDICNRFINWIKSFVQDCPEILISQVTNTFENFAKEAVAIDETVLSSTLHIIALPWHSIFEIIFSYQISMIPTLFSSYHPDLIHLLKSNLNENEKSSSKQKPLVGIIPSSPKITTNQQNGHTNNNNSSIKSTTSELTLDDLESPILKSNGNGAKMTTTMGNKKRDSDFSLSQPNQKLWKSSSPSSAVNQNYWKSTSSYSSAINPNYWKSKGGDNNKPTTTPTITQQKSQLEKLFESIAIEKRESKILDEKLFNLVQDCGRNDLIDKYYSQK
ncbi:hypothetical protein DFA_11691 [Cavenderia fasciculata]|uniref:RRM domain-containing protein n=1 Tax=Cavenderia fasciculata TaxID=261658 RepID=F4QDY3_CACFS|nr:uncharacterized protein DFA_11691 [Cavenderia fasciculata]EGG13930.1 hypothetical protein DFA_11691 [Cavenderia fasciculata]|eukprot:XP_004350638.1 hypothetical protein DFA_11691 [Cavenderia fasciculata]